MSINKFLDKRFKNNDITFGMLLNNIRYEYTQLSHSQQYNIGDINTLTKVKNNSDKEVIRLWNLYKLIIKLTKNTEYIDNDYSDYIDD